MHSIAQHSSAEVVYVPKTSYYII